MKRTIHHLSLKLSSLNLVPIVLVLALFGLSASTAGGAPVRERLSFNSDWRFTKDDPADTGNKLSYGTISNWVMATGADLTTNSQPAVRPEGNLGSDVSYTQPGFDDSAWRKLNLPHDWGIEGPFKQEYPGETGKLPWWGIGWYRKHFTVPEFDKDNRVYLDVDGAMAYANVWLNGQYVGGWPYGYASWRVDLTSYLKPGGENVIAIRLDNPPDSSRWYPGGGIYRNVWLVKTAPVHVAQWGTYVTTPEVSRDTAKVMMRVQVQNNAAYEVLPVFIGTRIYERKPDGHRGRMVLDAGRISVTNGIPVGQSRSETVTFTISKPNLWSAKSPNMYVAVTTLQMPPGSAASSLNTVDEYETPFGIRTIEFTADNGFLLNGERLRINGVCDHHDLGSLGSALNTRALERQLQILQEMGCNAIRTSHNPPAPELLDLADRMGFVVMDEAFDCWQRGKKKNDYHLLFDAWHEKDWRAQIRRDRNHPCVILWSTGNEIGEQGNAAGHLVSAELASITHQEDPTRPSTAGCNNVQAGYNGFQKTVDVFGYNYKPQEYGKFRQANPNLPLYASETSSCVSSRGEYFFPVSTNKADGKADFQVSSYDLYAPRWATLPDWEFKGQDEFSFAAGEFVWTGFDYLGEPTPYNSDMSNLINYTDPAEKARAEKELKEIGRILTPSRSSYFGIIDLAGFKKDRFYIYQARWRPDFPMAHILPHWNWPDRVGQITPVHVYTSGDEAELFLNGKSLGRQKNGKYEYRLHWDNVAYQPGELKVVAYKNGKKWATDSMKTTGAASKVTLRPDRDQIRSDGKDLSFVTVAVADKEGLMVPRSKNRIRFQIEGPGEIVATDNGDATSFESFQSKERNAYNGLCLVIVRSTAGKPGTIKLTAGCDGLKSGSVSIKTK
jgi:beta-galactosidase